MSNIVVFDIDGVVRDVAGSYRRALADTVENFTAGRYRPTQEEIDQLKAEGIWNNDWQASQELIHRYFRQQGQHAQHLDYHDIVAFFQSRYLGTDPKEFDGYITSEPLLLKPQYLAQLDQSGIRWGFFSGATRGSADYILRRRLKLEAPVLIAMEDAPGKPDPTGLLTAVRLLELSSIELSPVFYVGDTVADMYTVAKAKAVEPHRLWIGVGILPPHVQSSPQRQDAYRAGLTEAGAAVVYHNVQQLTPTQIEQLQVQAQSEGI
ncbi:MAG: TIGR01548 family HAD-type hydrolase [Cyanophyceae cyanobacterium]